MSSGRATAPAAAAIVIASLFAPTSSLESQQLQQAAQCTWLFAESGYEFDLYVLLTFV